MEVLVTKPDTSTQQVPVIEVEDTDLAKITDLVLHTNLSPQEPPKEKSIPIANIDDVVKFGKYKSENITWRQLLKENWDYVNWVYCNVTFIKLSDEIRSQL